MERQNITQQKHAFTNQNKCTTTQNKHKKLKPGLVASYGPDVVRHKLKTTGLIWDEATEAAINRMEWKQHVA